MLKPTCRPELLIWGFGITLKAVLCRCAQQRLRVNVEKKRWMGCWLLLFSYLQCWCVWYSRPPQPEFPAAVCGSLGYRRPYGSAAGCGDLDLWISRCGQRLLRHHHHHRPSSSFLSGAVDKIALFPRLSHTLTAPSSPHSRAPWYERQVWGARSGLKTINTRIRVSSFLCSSGWSLMELNIRIPLSEMRSFNALSVAPTACSLLLTRKTTRALK